ncbi:MAG: glycosyltransferase family 4 protein [Puniceicoccaceae bacterium]
MKPNNSPFPALLQRLLHRSIKGLRLLAELLRSRFEQADIAIFHELLPPPDGGGNQFIRAMARCFERQGFRVVFNRIPRGVKAVYFNSFNFNAREFSVWHRCFGGERPFIHRIDGPIQTYRGFDDGADAQVWSCNRRFATHSILQSHYSLEQHRELGVELVQPVLITNASDPDLFFPPIQRCPLEGRKVVLIATSWSDNPNKGLEIYQWLDAHLDFDRFEFRFAGRIRGNFRHIQVLGALESMALAEELRAADLYVTASRMDPCSNSLIEALTCGLPAVFLNSGGHPEIVGKAGLGFERAEQIPLLIDRILADYTSYQSAIVRPTIDEVAAQYLAVAQLNQKTT